MERGIEELLVNELHDILSCENQIVAALPNLVAAAECEKLKKAFATHLEETKVQIERLEKVFNLLKIEKEESFCKGTRGLIEECNDVLVNFKTPSAMRDATLIAKVQRIEHYEIAAYGTACTYAREIDLDDVADLLQATLNEEGSADKTLTKIAEGGLLSSGVNQKANTETKSDK